MNFDNFTGVCQDLAHKLVLSNKRFNYYVTSCGIFQPEKAVSINEPKEGFFSLKTNKSADYDDINFNIVKRCFGTLDKPLLHVFNLSFQWSIFPDKPKIE